MAYTGIIIDGLQSNLKTIKLFIMKKLLLITTLLATVFTNSQEKNEKLIIKKGTWSISGNFSLDFNDTKRSESTSSYSSESKNFGYNLFPKTSYFIDDNLSIGLGLGYGYHKDEHKDNNDAFDLLNSRKEYSIFPYIKKHIPVGKKVSISIQGEGRYTRNVYDRVYSSDYEQSSNTYFIGIRPGITLFISKKLALETYLGSLGYSDSKNSIKDSQETTYNTSRFSFNLNSSNLYFGLSYYL